jgi:hypothetical protein
MISGTRQLTGIDPLAGMPHERRGRRNPNGYAARLYEYIRRHPGATYAQIQKNFNWTHGQFETALVSTEANGLLLSEEVAQVKYASRPGYYEIARYYVWEA